jgi:phosphatidylinositol glycan class K
MESTLFFFAGRVEPSVPRSKRLLSDERSNIFVYMTGHGGNEFLKFQDNEEISAFDIADAFEQMWQKKRHDASFSPYDDALADSAVIRYNEIFFMIDTCQANTMYSKFYSPNILATGSSEIHESSFSVCIDRTCDQSFWASSKSPTNLTQFENDYDIGVAVIDSYTHFVLEFMEGINKTSRLSMQDLVRRAY